MAKPSLATQIVDAIIQDISDRKGLGNEWEAIDEDIQQEIKDEWLNTVNKILKKEDK